MRPFHYAEGIPVLIRRPTSFTQKLMTSLLGCLQHVEANEETFYYLHQCCSHLFHTGANMLHPSLKILSFFKDGDYHS